MEAPSQLSVVIPHLNEPDGNLRRCLLALHHQRTKDIAIEIIVVDNGSLEMPEGVCAGIPDIRLEREPIPGPGPARNRGASLARAELLAFVDADCVVQPGWANAIVDMMDSRPEIDLIGGDIGILMTDPRKPSSVELYESIYSYRARMYVERYGFAATGNMAVRRDVFRAIGPFGGIATMEDTEWGQRATSQGYRIAFLPEARVLTPSCKSFVELSRRWDRHVAHEYRQTSGQRFATPRWLAACAVMAASPLIEVFRILGSDRITGIRNRIFAMACLTRVRLYRARLMLSLVGYRDAAPLVETWNREKT